MGDLMGRQGIRTQLGEGVEFLPSVEVNDFTAVVTVSKSCAKGEKVFLTLPRPLKTIVNKISLRRGRFREKVMAGAGVRASPIAEEREDSHHAQYLAESGKNIEEMLLTRFDCHLTIILDVVQEEGRSLTKGLLSGETWRDC